MVGKKLKAKKKETIIVDVKVEEKPVEEKKRTFKEWLKDNTGIDVI